MQSQFLVIKAQPRDIKGKRVSKLRRAGKIPGVLYGHNVENLPLVLDRGEFESVFSQSGENTLIKLALEKLGERTVLVHEVQHHYLNDELSHVDFYEVKMTEKIKAKVPVIFKGEAKAVKDLGGVLVKNFVELEIESLPTDIPHAFEVDLGKLATFEDVVSVSDLAYDSSKIKLHVRPEEIIAKVSPPRSEEELKALEEKPVEQVAAVEGVVKEQPETEPEPEQAVQPEQKT